MKPAKRRVAVLAEYILDLGLSLPMKLDELFQTEFKAAFDVKWERRADEDDWTGFEEELKKDMRHDLAAGRSRILTMMTRQLRSFQFIAVGRIPDGSLVIIHPRDWDRLKAGYGTTSVTDGFKVRHDVHVAAVSSLGLRQRAELDELLYNFSSERVAKRHIGQDQKGRDPKKRAIIEKWIKEKQAAGPMPKSQSAAMAQAKKHFAPLLAKAQISEETIRRILKEFYSRQITVANPHK